MKGDGVSQRRTTIPSSTLLNLTPFNVIVFPTNGALEDDKTRDSENVLQPRLILYPKSGIVAHLVSARQRVLEPLRDGCPVVEPQQFVSVSPTAPPFDLVQTHDGGRGLPTEDNFEGVIVTMPVAEWLCDTADLDEVRSVWRSIYVADLGPAGVVRNAANAIIGTRRLCCYLAKHHTQEEYPCH